MQNLPALLAPYVRKINNMLSRGMVTMVNSGSKMQGLQIALQEDELKDDMEHFEQYGITSHPPAGAEALAAFLNGDRSHGLVIAVAHRAYRLQNLEAGEVAIYDDQGAKVHLTREGIVIDGGGKQLLITNTPTVRMETPMLEVTGDIQDNCDTNTRTMKGMRDRYNIHHHNETGSITQTPNEAM